MMDEHTATEIAYKNGYAKGYADGKGKWISVEERLPEESGSYLVIATSGYLFTLDYSAKHKLFNSCDDFSEEYAHGLAISVTHWMPLPEPPKGE